MLARVRTTAVIVVNICLLPLYLSVAAIIIGFGLPFMALWWLLEFLFGE